MMSRNYPDTTVLAPGDICTDAGGGKCLSGLPPSSDKTQSGVIVIPPGDKKAFQTTDECPGNTGDAYVSSINFATPFTSPPAVTVSSSGVWLGISLCSVNKNGFSLVYHHTATPNLDIIPFPGSVSVNWIAAPKTQ